MSTPLTGVTVGAKINELTSNYFLRRKALKVWRQSLDDGKSPRDSARSAFTVAATRPNDVVGTENRVTRAMDELEDNTVVDSNVAPVTTSTGSTTLHHASQAASSDSRKSLIIAGVVGAVIGGAVLSISTVWVLNSFSEAFGPLVGWLMVIIYAIVTFAACIFVALFVVDRRNSTIVDSSETTKTDGLNILNPPRP